MSVGLVAPAVLYLESHSEEGWAVCGGGWGGDTCDDGREGPTW